MTTARRPKPRRCYLRLTQEELAAIARAKERHAPYTVTTSEVLHLMIATGIKTLEAMRK